MAKSNKLFNHKTSTIDVWKSPKFAYIASTFCYWIDPIFFTLIRPPYVENSFRSNNLYLKKSNLSFFQND